MRARNAPAAVGFQVALACLGLALAAAVGVAPTHDRHGRPARRWQYPYGHKPEDVPNRRQLIAHGLWADELLYGGAAGGGKSDYLLAELVISCLENPGLNAVVFRRTFKDLSRPSGLIYRLLERLPRRIARYNATSHTWKFRNGSLLELGALEHDADVLKYQGAEYGLIAFDELTQFTEYQYRYMSSRLRVSGDLLEAGYRPRMIAASNPGGPGHGWVKDRFVDPAPPEVVWQPEPTEDEPAPGTRVFVPATVEDNAEHVDKGYLERLRGLPLDDRRALYEGDWDVYQGQRFRAFRRHIHVIDPEQYPIPIGAGVTRGIGVDYGLDAPFAALWGAVGADGLIVIYRELYEPGLTPTEQAERILAAELPGERGPGRPMPTWADPSMFNRSPTSPPPTSRTAAPIGSVAELYNRAGVPVLRANNDRLAGVAKVADKLRVRADDLPRILIYSTCRNLIRTLPSLQRDPLRPEDVDTNGEDHAYDALRYLLFGLERAPAPASDPRSRPRSPSSSVSGKVRKQGF